MKRPKLKCIVGGRHDILQNDALQQINSQQNKTIDVSVIRWMLWRKMKNYGEVGRVVFMAFIPLKCSQRDHNTHIERANRHCQGMECARSFYIGLTSAEGQKLVF